MPFTPLHMGPAASFKLLGGRHFSFTVFGFSQVLIDLEPLIRIIGGDTILHGPTHTYLGALVVAVPAALLGRPLCSWLLRVWNRRASTTPALRVADETIGAPVAWTSALLGTLSHVFFDSFMHADMHPFAPFDDGNPLWLAISVEDLHWLCVIAGAVGGLGLLVLRLSRPRRL